MNTEQTIEQLLQETFHLSHFELINDSHKHQGHAGWKETADTHFFVTLVSEDFEGVSRVKRHQLVYKALNDLMKNTIHALQIAAYTEKEWENKGKL
jgi:BolA protein